LCDVTNGKSHEDVDNESRLLAVCPVGDNANAKYIDIEKKEWGKCDSSRRRNSLSTGDISLQVSISQTIIYRDTLGTHFWYIPITRLLLYWYNWPCIGLDICT
jgi:hypothetical protein